MKDVFDNLPESRIENELMVSLRHLSSYDFYETIKPLLVNKQLKKIKTGLRFVKRRNLKEEELKRILWIGLQKNDVSEIGMWLDVILIKLGPRKTLKYLKILTFEHCELVDTALYNLRILINQHYTEFMQDFLLLKEYVNFHKLEKDKKLVH